MVTELKSHDSKKKSTVLNRTKKQKIITINPEEYGQEILTVSELITAQPKHTFCEQSLQLFGTPVDAFTIDINEILVRKASMDGSVPKLLHVSLRARFIYQAQYSTLSQRLRELLLYRLLRRR